MIEQEEMNNNDRIDQLNLEPIAEAPKTDSKKNNNKCNKFQELLESRVFAWLNKTEYNIEQQNDENIIGITDNIWNHNNIVVFPTTLSSKDRHVVHSICGKLKLYHSTFWQGTSRVICISKTNNFTEQLLELGLNDLQTAEPLVKDELNNNNNNTTTTNPTLNPETTVKKESKRSHNKANNRFAELLEARVVAWVHNTSLPVPENDSPTSTTLTPTPIPGISGDIWGHEDIVVFPYTLRLVLYICYILYYIYVTYYTILG